MKYVMRGGPMDGQEVDPPPAMLHAVAKVVGDAIGGRVASTPRCTVEDEETGEVWTYEFAPDEAGVLVGRLADEFETAMWKAQHQ